VNGTAIVSLASKKKIAIWMRRPHWVRVFKSRIAVR